MRFDKWLMPPRWMLFAVGFLAGGVWGWWRWVDSNRAPALMPATSEMNKSKPTPRPNDYVGSQACRECHADIYQTYMRHPMANSAAPAYAENPVEDFGREAHFSPNPQTKYQVERVGNRVLHHEIGLDDQGQVIYDQAVEIDYAIGSGKRGRSYLIDHDGVLFQSPISWYSQKSRWDLSPGYTPGKHPRFDRRATDRCLQCHVGRVNAEPHSPGIDLVKYRQPPFLELGIGCERCHGPAQAHIQRHRGNGASDVPDPIVNPSRLPRSQRDSVCNQCHLQGEIHVLRYGRRHGDFRPGDHLGDIWSIFVEGTGVDDSGSTTAVSQVQQMIASQCYVKSQGELGCVSCHDPHFSPAEVETANHYNRRCQVCHHVDDCSASMETREQAPAHGSCIACHMPRLSAHDVPHISQTDHRIPRSPQLISARETDVNQTASVHVFDANDCPLGDADEALAMALMQIEQVKAELDRGKATEAADQLHAIRVLFPDDVRIWDGLGICASIGGRSERSKSFWLQVLSIDPKHEAVLYSLALDAVARGEVAQGLEFIDRYLEVNPWSAEMHWHRSKLLFRRGQLDEALAAGQRAVELNPSVPESYEWLAKTYRSAGQTEKADELDQLVKRLRHSGGSEK